MQHCDSGKRSLAVYLAMALVAAVVLVDAFVLYSARAPFGVVAVVAFALAFACWAVFAFVAMRFCVSERELSLKFFPFSYKILLKDITQVEIVDSLPWWRGWGLRMWGRSLYFVSDHAGAVLVRKKTGFFKEVVFTPSDAERFVEKLKAR